MRAGEIVGLTRDNLDLDNKVAHLPMTKNGHARDVPLSSAAVDLIAQLPPDLDPVFGLTSRQLDVLFRKIKSRALVDGLTFHDSRAAALTMLSRKVDVMTLAKISGHRDLRILQNVYYRETAADIAARLG
jgi:integrase